MLLGGESQERKPRKLHEGHERGSGELDVEPQSWCPRNRNQAEQGQGVW